MDDAADLFTLADPWKPSQWLTQSFPTTSLGDKSFFSLSIPDSSRDQPQNLPTQESGDYKLAHDGFFKLPSLMDSTMEECDPGVSIPAEQSEFPEEPEPDAVDEDPWLSQHLMRAKPPQFRTWEAFVRPGTDNIDFPGPPAQFISEAGADAFDALYQRLSTEMTDEDDELVLNAADYCACLLSLAMGRGSVLFSWNPGAKSFERTAARFRASGLSAEALAGVCDMCLECANLTQSLRTLVDKTYSTAPSATKIALADVVDKILLATQYELGYRAQTVRSILQLKAVVQPIHATLVHFLNLTVELTRAKTDEDLLSLLFQAAQVVDYSNLPLRNAICEVLRMVSTPWTSFVEEWMGLQPETGIALTRHGPGKGFVRVGTQIWIDEQGFELEEPDYFLDEQRMPSFVPQEMASTIFETGRSLRFIKENHPEHALAESKVITASDPPQLRWEFDWEAIAKLEDRAHEYEANLARAVQDARARRTDGQRSASVAMKPQGYQPLSLGQSELSEKVLATMARFDEALAPPAEKSGLAATLRKRLFKTDNLPALTQEFTPHWSLLPLLSFGPVVTAQARQVNRECVRLLFTSHQLRTHLDLQKQYHLLGNGLFCSRLSHALFDPELDTAERQTGVALSGSNMGLRLSGRKNWPPASSELRLALMGVLSESYEKPRDGDRSMSNSAAMPERSFTLPGDLSFGVRELGPEEIERCIKPDGLEALDFLRLSYKPPVALRPVLTPLILFKYDRIFQLLLRVLRMLFTTNQFFRDILTLAPSDSVTSDDAILRFRVEAQHFISQIAAHFFTDGVAVLWQRFATWLDTVEAEALREDDGRNPEAVDQLSPETLRQRHEQLLDDVLLVLLLRKRQGPVLELLEDIFRLILRFAKSMRLRAVGATDAAGEDRPEKLYARFRRKVEIFITVCRGLSEKVSVGLPGETGQERRTVGDQDTLGSSMERLVMKLDMSGFYAKKTAN